MTTNQKRMPNETLQIGLINSTVDKEIAYQLLAPITYHKIYDEGGAFVFQQYLPNQHTSHGNIFRYKQAIDAHPYFRRKLTHNQIRLTIMLYYRTLSITIEECRLWLLSNTELQLAFIDKYPLTHEITLTRRGIISMLLTAQGITNDIPIPKKDRNEINGCKHPFISFQDT